MLFNKTTNELVISNIGDAACFICREDKLEELSVAHKPSNTTEKERIEKAGFRVIGGRINSIIAVSRSFGDKEFKSVSNIPQEEQPLTCIPNIIKTTLQKTDKFIVMCCDGITDALSPEEIINFVSSEIGKQTQFQLIAQKLCEEAIGIII